MLQLQLVSYATCILSAFERLVSKCHLFYCRVVVQLLVKQKLVMLLFGGLPFLFFYAATDYTEARAKFYFFSTFEKRTGDYSS